MALVQGMQIAALRGGQGGREYYVAMVANSDLNNFFTVNMDPKDDRSQRQLDPRHAREIAEYLISERDNYVLGALVYAVDASCTFEPSPIHDSMGVLTIPFGVNLRSIDGQHRRQGLNEAISDEPDLASDSTAVLIYVEPDLKRRRQMFSDMNATPKSVSKAINVKFDSRDPFAIAAQNLVDTHPLLKGRTDTEAARVRRGSDDWFTLGAVYDSLKRLYVGGTGRVRNPGSYSADAIEEFGAKFFDLINGSRSEFDDVRRGIATIEEMRERSIMFSSTTLRALAIAVHMRLEHDGWGTDLTSRYGKYLKAMDLSPSASAWTDSGFVSVGKTTPNARNQEVLAAARVMSSALNGGR